MNSITLAALYRGQNCKQDFKIDFGGSVAEDFKFDFPFTSSAIAYIMAASEAAFATTGTKTTLPSVTVEYGAVAETWTLTCTTGGGSGTAQFSVVGSVSGAKANATVGTAYANTGIGFTITGGTIASVVGDTFTIILTANKTVGSVVFTTTGPTSNVTTLAAGGTNGITLESGAVAETWTLICTNVNDDGSAVFSVVGSVSGTWDSAVVNVGYSNGLIAFTILPNTNPSIVGDTFVFTITQAIISGAAVFHTVGTKASIPLITLESGAVAETWTLTCTTPGASGTAVFSVVGSVSGTKAAATVGTAYANAEVGFTITGGTVPSITGDTLIFTVSEIATGSNIPVASFTVGSSSGLVPLTVSFTDTSTEGPTSWFWQFGDNVTSTVQNPTHTYYDEGVFGVTLTATNNNGSDTTLVSGAVIVKTPKVDPAQQTVLVTPKPVAAFSATPLTGAAPLSVQFTDGSTGSVDQWDWDFGDSGQANVQNPLYVYTVPGTYTVTLGVTGGGGSSTGARANYITVTA